MISQVVKEFWNPRRQDVDLDWVSRHAVFGDDGWNARARADRVTAMLAADERGAAVDKECCGDSVVDLQPYSRSAGLRMNWHLDSAFFKARKFARVRIEPHCVNQATCTPAAASPAADPRTGARFIVIDDVGLEITGPGAGYGASIAAIGRRPVPANRAVASDSGAPTSLSSAIVLQYVEVADCVGGRR